MPNSFFVVLSSFAPLSYWFTAVVVDMRFDELKAYGSYFLNNSIENDRVDGYFLIIFDVGSI